MAMHRRLARKDSTIHIYRIGESRQLLGALISCKQDVSMRAFFEHGKVVTKLGCAGTLAMLLFVWCLGCFIGGIAVAHWTHTDKSPSEYASVHLGDSRAAVVRLLTDDRFRLLGHLSKVDGKTIWIDHQYQSGPIRSELTDSQLAENAYLRNSGYSYPNRPVPHELYLFLDRQAPGLVPPNYIYYLLDESGAVMMIYLGIS